MNSQEPRFAELFDKSYSSAEAWPTPRRMHSAYLGDIVEAATVVANWTEGRILEEIQLNDVLRSALERQLEIVSVASNNVLVLERSMAERIPGIAELATLYDRLSVQNFPTDWDAIWPIVTITLPATRDWIRHLLPHPEDAHGETL